MHGWCRRILKAMHVEYTVQGVPPSSGALVSNHLSYLDILLYSAITPFVMVAKLQVRSWPLIGYLTHLAGTVYVERSEDAVPGRPRQMHAEVNRKMAEAYASGLPVLFFPEGTTTDGTQILPFRRGLFHSVLNGNIPLRVSALHLQLEEENDGATVEEDVCFVGDAELAPHLFGFLSLRGLQAQVCFGEEVTDREDRFVLSQSAREEIADLYEQLGGQVRETAGVGRTYESSLVEAL